jgi:hypothetical protein
MAIFARKHAGLRSRAASLWIVVRRRPKAGLGCILLAIASLWLAVPTFGLLAGEATPVPRLGSSGVYWAGAVGVGPYDPELEARIHYKLSASPEFLRAALVIAVPTEVLIWALIGADLWSGIS